MLTPETKKHIDNARQVLVGKVPDPKSQIEQITNALVYKFMDDMDEQSSGLGGKRKYFTGDYEKYSWKLLMSESLGAHDRLLLYRDALERMSKNPNLPELFRSIFRNAFLPYNDARTLSLFLKEIEYFSYNNSEELGNGYEYLLSIMGSQGDAGQFRTPRHIIDFIVSAVNPSKDDTVLDPACGTAGFLISAYKHVVAKHDGKDDITGVIEQNTKELRLTADERKKLYKSYHGFDIDDNMVKMAKVNMYLHSFPEPNIVVHDSLSSEEYWEERYDVILANPPFMSPKGGIEPHKKFGIQANRAEVLFVDYITSHLKPSGRAGVIVPEGVIFQSGKAYKELRKNLVNNSLYAVISLPAGVFQPYSGVKTSILLLDREIAKNNDKILFVSVENDGFSLGTQRREVDGTQLPEALDIIKQFRKGEDIESSFAHAVTREQIAQSGGYELNGDGYKTSDVHESAEYTTVTLRELVDITTGKKDVNQGNPSGKYPFFTCAKEHTYSDSYSYDQEALLIAGNGDVGNVKYYKGKFEAYQRTYILSNFKNVLPRYLYHVLNQTLKPVLVKQKLGNTMPYIKMGMLSEYMIPLPSMDEQAKITEELDNYQVIADATQTILKTYKPKFKVNPIWPKVKIGEYVTLVRGVTYSKTDEVNKDGHSILRANNIDLDGSLNLSDIKHIAVTLNLNSEKQLRTGDTFICLASGSKDHIGKVAYINEDTEYYFGGFMGVVRTKDRDILLPSFVYHCLASESFNAYLRNAISGANINNINSSILNNFEIPLPPIHEQQAIVDQLAAEKRLMDSNTMLLETYVQKIRDKITEVWNV